GAPTTRAGSAGEVVDGPQQPPDHPAGAPDRSAGRWSHGPQPPPDHRRGREHPVAEGVPPRPPPPVARPPIAAVGVTARRADLLSALHCKATHSGGQPLRAVASGTAASGHTGRRPERRWPAPGREPATRSARGAVGSYLMILVTRPEPTVRPPSRMANSSPSSMAIGAISSTVISVLSPGMHISTPSGSLIVPVTSVVRK